MKRSIKKSEAFLVALFTLAMLFILVLSVAKDLLEIIGNSFVYGIAIITTSYITGNVADNALKGRFFNATMYDGAQPVERSPDRRGYG